VLIGLSYPRRCIDVPISSSYYFSIPGTCPTLKQIENLSRLYHVHVGFLEVSHMRRLSISLAQAFSSLHQRLFFLVSSLLLHANSLLDVIEHASHPPLNELPPSCLLTSARLASFGRTSLLSHLAGAYLRHSPLLWSASRRSCSTPWRLPGVSLPSTGLAWLRPRPGSLCSSMATGVRLFASRPTQPCARPAASCRGCSCTRAPGSCFRSITPSRLLACYLLGGM
jgi:hypothetical protein